MNSRADTLAKRWLRRSITLPLLFLTTSAMLLLFPILMPLALLIDAMRRRLILGRALAFFLLFLVCESVGIGCCLLLWLCKPLLGSARFLRANLALQFRWAETLRRCGFWLFGIRVTVEGQALLSQGPLLLFMRHSSMADTMLPIMLAGSAHGMWLRWVMKRELLWDPCLDVVGNRLPNCFVSRNPSSREKDLAAIRVLASGLGPKEGVVLWPEGTRFSENKRQRILQKLRAHGSPEEHAAAEALRNVLPIRPGGALCLLRTAPDCDLVFCAHYGLDAAVRFSDLWHGSVIGSSLHIHCFRVAAKDVPTEPTLQVAFLRDQWQRVDRLVGHARRACQAENVALAPSRATGPQTH